MTHGLWLSAGGLQINEYRQSLAANNMANVDTVGFKNDLALIHQRRIESTIDGRQQPYSNPMLDALSGGTWVRPTHTSFAQGTLEETGDSLDAAIFGDGFFTVSDGAKQMYTRDGRFTRNIDGELVLAAGDGRYRVLDRSGSPIFINPTLGEVNISPSGTITQNGAQVAQLGIVDFEDRAALRKVGTNVFENVGDTRPSPATPKVQGGYVERSTVNPIDALTNMIEVTRAYELNARMISLQDDTLGQAVTRVGRLA
jgi:flagellar basal-body rod protein FlgG